MSAKQTPTDDVAPPKKKGSKLLIILSIVLGIVLAAGAGAAGAYFLTQPAPEEAAAAEEQAAPKEAEKPAKKAKKTAKKEAEPSAFVVLEPFVTNLLPVTPGDDDKYVQTTISLEVDGPAAEGFVKENIHRIRSILTMSLSSHTPADLATPKGKLALASELKDAFNEALTEAAREKPDVPDNPVLNVLFDALLIQ